MEQWKEYKLGDICKTNISQYSAKENWDNALYLDTGNITDNKINEIVTINDMTHGLPSRARRKVKDKDILFSTVRPNQRHIGILQNPQPNLLVSTGFTVISANQDVADSYFLYYFLSQKEIVDYLHAIAEQAVSAYPSIKASDIEDLDILLPNLSQQKKISKLLKSLDAKIELNRQINDNLEQQAQALFNDMFFNNIELERYSLSNYADINPFRNLKKNTVARFIEMSNLPTQGSFPLNWDYKLFNGGMKFTNGDTIMARITPCLENGKTAYIDFLDDNEVAFGSTEYIVFSAKEDYCPALFYFLARNQEFIDYAISHMNGSSGRQRVSGNDIANFPMPHISKDLSDKFDKIVMPIMSNIRDNSIMNRSLVLMRNTLLPRLMSGELKINEINC